MYLQKIGTKFEASTKKTAACVAGGISITHQISNTCIENRKNASAPPVTNFITIPQKYFCKCLNLYFF